MPVIPVLLLVWSLTPSIAEGCQYFLKEKEGHCGEEEKTCLTNNTCIYEHDKNAMACPLWFHCSVSNMCKCNQVTRHDKIIKCNNNMLTASILDCYCATHDMESDQIVVGPCIETCAHPDQNLSDDIYRLLPNALSDLNQEMCGKSNRDGVMCGSCNTSFYPQLYSFNYTCINADKCKGKYREWLKYIFVAYVPLTVFYLIVLFFRINVTTSYLHAYIFFCQAITMPLLLRVIFTATANRQSISMALKVLSLFYGIWNLDFFKSFYDGMICLDLDPLTVTAMDYIVAVYPLVLSIISYGLIALYDRKISCIVTLWKPMKYILSLSDSSWDSHTSVVDAYATFFLLSYAKFLSVSFNLLMPITLYHVNSNEQTSLVLFYDGSKEYFKGKHLPYGVIGIVFFSTFNVFPIIILLLYQCACFQKIIAKLPLRLDILHTFMDLLQGCYNNGTEPDTRDLRWFSAIFLIGRVLLFLCFGLSFNGMFFVFGAVICIVLVNFIVSVQPYKKKYSHYILIHSIFLMFLALIFTAIAGVNIAAVVDDQGYIIHFFYFLSAVLAIVPFICMCVHTAYWLISHCRPLVRLSKGLLCQVRGITSNVQTS